MSVTGGGLCISCFDEEPQGLRCESGHFLCGECINGLVASQIGTAELKRRLGGLACMAVDEAHAEPILQRRETAFARSCVEPFLQGDVHKQYGTCLASIAEEASDEASAPSNLLHWVSELLNVTCPRCDEILDPRPDGCVAMKCLHCDVAFCWQCFECCDIDAHGHVIDVHGQHFPPLAEVETWHRRWRWRRIARLLTAGALPSKLPQCREAAHDLHNTRLLKLSAAEIERIRPAKSMLLDFGLWPMPPTQPKVKDGMARSALILAAISGDVAFLFADADAEGGGLAAGLADGTLQLDENDARFMTALHHACHGGHARFARCLLDLLKVQYLDEAASANEGADVDPAHLRFLDYLTMRNEQGSGALSLACREGHYAAAALVLEACCEVDTMALASTSPCALSAKTRAELVAPLMTADDGCMTPLAHAASALHVDIVHLLLRHGASVHSDGLAYEHMTALGHALRSWGWQQETADPRTLEVTLTLLAHARDHEPEALPVAAHVANHSGALPRAYLAGWRHSSELVAALLSLPDIDVNALDPLSGCSALAVAARYGALADVKLLAAMGAQNGRDDEGKRRGRDALAWAFAQGHEEITQFLLSQPVADPTAAQLKSWLKLKTAGRWLGRAACMDAAEQVRVWLRFIERKDDERLATNSVASDTDTPPGDKSGAVRYVSKAATLAYQGSDGFTALHFAARHGSIGTAALLLRAGADPFCKDQYGRKPHHYAVLYHHEELLKVLPSLSDEEMQAIKAPPLPIDDDDDEVNVYTYDMWDTWYEEHGWGTEGIDYGVINPAEREARLGVLCNVSVSAE